MPQRKEQFQNGEIYHITIRRIGGNTMFKDINDYYRGIFSIYEFNNDKPVSIRQRRKERKKEKSDRADRVRDSVSSEIIDRREKLVDVLSFCLMPNHVHLLVRQLKDGGVSKFMNKFGSGYSRYFKDRYGIKKRGYFFDNRFHSVHIETDEQLRAVFVYIHSNPVSLIESNWKEMGIKNPEKVIKFLESYKWSSYQDYLGKKNFSSVTERNFLLEVMCGIRGCRQNVTDWIKYKGDLREFSKLISKVELELE